MVHSIVKAMVNFSREFNIDLITEGVETTQQSQAIKTLGCEIAQGFLFSRPQPLAYWLNGYTDAGN